MRRFHRPLTPSVSNNSYVSRLIEATVKNWEHGSSVRIAAVDDFDDIADLIVNKNTAPKGKKRREKDDLDKKLTTTIPSEPEPPIVKKKKGKPPVTQPDLNFDDIADTVSNDVAPSDDFDVEEVNDDGSGYENYHSSETEDVTDAISDALSAQTDESQSSMDSVEELKKQFPVRPSEEYDEHSGVPLTLQAWMSDWAHKFLPKTLNLKNPKKRGPVYWTFKKFVENVKKERPTDYEENLKPLLTQSAAKKVSRELNLDLKATDKKLLKNYTEKFNKNMDLLSNAYLELAGRRGTIVDGTRYTDEDFRQDWGNYLKGIFSDPERVNDIASYLLRQDSLSPLVQRTLLERARGGLTESESKMLTPDAMSDAVTSYLHNKGQVDPLTKKVPHEYQLERGGKPQIKMDSEGNAYPLMTSDGKKSPYRDQLEYAPRQEMWDRGILPETEGKGDDLIPNIQEIPNKALDRDYDSALMDFVMNKAEGKVDKNYVRPSLLSDLSTDQVKSLEGAGRSLGVIFRNQKQIAELRQEAKHCIYLHNKIEKVDLPNLSRQATMSENAKADVHEKLQVLLQQAHANKAKYDDINAQISDLQDTTNEMLDAICNQAKESAMSRGADEDEANQIAEVGRKALIGKARLLANPNVTLPDKARDKLGRGERDEISAQYDAQIGELFRTLSGAQLPNQTTHTTIPVSKEQDLKLYQDATRTMATYLHKIVDAARAMNSASTPEDTKSAYGDFKMALAPLESFMTDLNQKLDTAKTPDPIRMGIAKNVKGFFNNPKVKDMFAGKFGSTLFQELLSAVDENSLKIATQPGERSFSEAYLEDQRGKTQHLSQEIPFGVKNKSIDRANPMLYKKLRDLDASKGFDPREMASFISQGISAGVRNPLNDAEQPATETPMSQLQFGNQGDMSSSMVDEGLNQDDVAEQMGGTHDPYGAIEDQVSQGEGAFYSQDPVELRGNILQAKTQTLGDFTRFNKRSDEAKDILERATEGNRFLQNLRSKLARDQQRELAQARKDNGDAQLSPRKYEFAIKLLYDNKERADVIPSAQELLHLAMEIEDAIKHDYKPLKREIESDQHDPEFDQQAAFTELSDIKDHLSELSARYSQIKQHLNKAASQLQAVSEEIARILGKKYLDQVENQMKGNARLISIANDFDFSQMVKAAAETLKGAIDKRNQLYMKLSNLGGRDQATESAIAVQDQRIGQVAQSLRAQFREGSLAVDPIQSQKNEADLRRKGRAIEQRLNAARATYPAGSPEIKAIEAELAELHREVDESNARAMEEGKKSSHLPGMPHRSVSKNEETGEYEAKTSRNTRMTRGFFWDVDKMGDRPETAMFENDLDKVFHRAGVDLDPIMASSLFYAMGLDPKEGHFYALRHQNNAADDGNKARVFTALQALGKKIGTVLNGRDSAIPTEGLSSDLIMQIINNPSEYDQIMARQFEPIMRQNSQARALLQPLINEYGKAIDEYQLSPMQKALRQVTVNGAPIDPKVARLMLKDPANAFRHFKDAYFSDSSKLPAGRNINDYIFSVCPSIKSFVNEFGLTSGALDQTFSRMNMVPKGNPQSTDVVNQFITDADDKDTKKMNAAEAEAEAWSQVELIKDRLFAEDKNGSVPKILDHAFSYSNYNLGDFNPKMWVGVNGSGGILQELDGWSKKRPSQVNRMDIESLIKYAGFMGLMYADSMENILSTYIRNKNTNHSKHLYQLDSISGGEGRIYQQKGRGMVADGVEKFFHEMQIAEPIREQIRQRFGYSIRQDGSGGRTYFTTKPINGEDGKKSSPTFLNLVGDPKRVRSTMIQVSNLAADLRILAKMSADGMRPQDLTPQQIKSLAQSLSTERLHNKMLVQRIPTLANVEDKEQQFFAISTKLSPKLVDRSRQEFASFKKAIVAYHAADGKYKVALDSGDTQTAKTQHEAARAAYTTLITLASNDNDSHPAANAFKSLMGLSLTTVMDQRTKAELLENRLTQMRGVSNPDTSTYPQGARGVSLDTSSPELQKRNQLPYEYPATAPRLPGDHPLWSEESPKVKPVPVQMPVQPKVPLNDVTTAPADPTKTANQIEVLARFARECEEAGDFKTAAVYDKRIAQLASKVIV